MEFKYEIQTDEFDSGNPTRVSGKILEANQLGNIYDWGVSDYENVPD